MMRSSGAPRRLRSDDGAAMVETALTLPIVFTLVLGLIEFGVVFRDYVTVSNAATGGARIGSIVGNAMVPMPGGRPSQSGDYQIIETIRNELGAIPPTWVKSIVVFKGQSGTNSPLSQVPAGCKANGAVSSSSLGCNVYNPYQAFVEQSTDNAAYFTCATSSVACGWPPVSRKDGTGSTTNNPTIDYVGVYIKLDRKYITGLFGNSFTLEVAAVQRIEPGFLDD